MYEHPLVVVVVALLSHKGYARSTDIGQQEAAKSLAAIWEGIDSWRGKYTSKDQNSRDVIARISGDRSADGYRRSVALDSFAPSSSLQRSTATEYQEYLLRTESAEGRPLGDFVPLKALQRLRVLECSQGSSFSGAYLSLNFLHGVTHDCSALSLAGCL